MYELQALESLLAQESPAMEELQVEQQRIESAFLRTIYSDRIPESIRNYIKQHIILLDNIFRKESLNPKKRSEAINTVASLIAFLEKHGFIYWSYDLQITLLSKQIIAHKIENQLNEARGVLEKLDLGQEFIESY